MFRWVSDECKRWVLTGMEREVIGTLCLDETQGDSWGQALHFSSSFTVKSQPGGWWSHTFLVWNNKMSSSSPFLHQDGELSRQFICVCTTAHMCRQVKTQTPKNRVTYRDLQVRRAAGDIQRRSAQQISKQKARRELMSYSGDQPRNVQQQKLVSVQHSSPCWGPTLCILSSSVSAGSALWSLQLARPGRQRSDLVQSNTLFFTCRK